jgi:hypothetical protein
MKGDRERCLAAGMDDYVSKPVQPAELLRVVRSVRSGTDALDLPSLANSASDSTLAPERVVFDRASALDRVAGDETILSEVIGLFLAEVPGQLDNVRQAVAAGDCKALGDVAHTLKGSAGCLGGLAASAALEPCTRSARSKPSSNRSLRRCRPLSCRQTHEPTGPPAAGRAGCSDWSVCVMRKRRTPLWASRTYP